ncbi:TatD family hydrolase [Algicola sagamiensis]|uniref:TatD family hydrolase n=1 Tax=Algicola sagamiensis TaxID=163869 RepID=UPI00036F796D|nr:YchF/TatD family DNA exonuclease [Algicola sagamiensis]
MLIDSHCHLDRINYAKSNSSMAEVLDFARDRGVKHFLCVSVTLDEFPTMLSSVEAHSDISVSCGVHPCDIEETLDFALLREYASHEKVVALGETGLDYYYSSENKIQQQESFAQHIQLANEIDKPVIVHTRDAREDTIAVMRDNHADKCGGVLHCFTENWEMAKAALDLGWYISISGIVTFKNAEALRDVVRKLPLDRLLIETDSPYLAPVPFRGKQNQPGYVKEVAEYVANLKGLRDEALIEATGENFARLFKKAKLTA